MKKIFCMTLVLFVFVSNGFTEPEDYKKTLADKGIEFSEENFSKEVEQGNIENVNLFLKAGMDPNAGRWRGARCPAILSAFACGHDEIVKLLLEKGADINAKEETDGTTPLMLLSSMAGKADVIRLLIEEGADVNAKDARGYTPLMFASRYGWIDTIKELKKSGADINAKNNNGETASDIATLRGHEEVVRFLSGNYTEENERYIKELESKKNLRFTADDFLTAVRHGDKKLVALFIKAGMDPDTKDYMERTPLMNASNDGYIDIVKLLIDAGANVDAKEERGGTALMVASNKCSPQ